MKIYEETKLWKDPNLSYLYEKLASVVMQQKGRSE